MRLFPALGRLQLVVLLCATLAGVATVNADTLIVTTTADAGAGSLRAAIAAANDGDTIQFAAALNGQSITLTSGTLVIDKDITIDGPGANQLAVTKSSGAPDFGLFSVPPLHIIIIEGLTIDGNGTLGAGVWIDRSQVALDGCVVQGCLGYGGVRCYASLEDHPNVTVVNSTIRNNQANVAGGGIYINGDPSTLGHASVNIINSAVSNNTVPGSSGNASGGGIWSQNGEVQITNSIVSNNVSGGNGPLVPFGNGGGISNSGGSLMLISDSTISGNSTGLNGGGIYNAGFMSLTRSTVSGNTAMGINDLEGWGDGAGIYNGDITTIINSTLSNNNSTRSGGAVSNSGSLTISHGTLSGNIAFEGSTIVNYNGATVQIGNTALKVSTISPSSISNHSGTITSNGYNLINDNGSGFFTATGDQINTEPMLGPLQNNGGPTFTHELLTGSPAIDTGDPSFTPPPLNDQRGPLYARVFNGRIDIGSLEVQPAPPTTTPTPTPTPTPVGPDLALTQSDSPDPVQVGNNLTYTITVFNLDPHNSALASVVDTLPAGVNFVSATPSQGSCTGTSTVVCNLGSLPGGASVTISLVVTPTAAGTLSNTATVSSFEDPNPSNNSDTELTTVNSVPTPTATPPATPTPTLTPPTATPTPTPTPTATPSPSPARALNMSTRMLVETGDRVGIGGFIITGPVPKRVILRGLGPSAGFAVPDKLADPVMELHGPGGFATIINDNWRDTQEAEIQATGIPPTDNLESAILMTLDPGSYTAIVKGKNNTSGVGLVEVYDLDQAPTSRLANISTRAFVGTGDHVTIGGFILGGGEAAQIDIYAIGPSLAASGVSGVLADPTLELRDSNGVLLASNDNCGAISIHPLDPLEACIEISLPPGAFTAILAGKNGGTGIGLVEIYNVD